MIAFRMMTVLTTALAMFAPTVAQASIPAAPVMTLYRFNGALELPYFEVNAFAASGPATPAGSLAQGTTVIPCLALRGGVPVTDGSGTPWVGFQVVVDARTATPASWWPWPPPRGGKKKKRKQKNNNKKMTTS